MLEVQTRCIKCRALVLADELSEPCPKGETHNTSDATDKAVGRLLAAVERPEYRHLTHGIFVRPNGDLSPYLTEHDKDFLGESKALSEHLFDLADVFFVPVTNNLPWFEGNDLRRPVYTVGEFQEAIMAAIKAHPDDVRALLEETA